MRTVIASSLTPTAHRLTQGVSGTTRCAAQAFPSCFSKGLPQCRLKLPGNYSRLQSLCNTSRKTKPSRISRGALQVTRAGWNDFEWQPASVVQKKKAADGLVSFTLEVGKDLVGGYSVPGQFVQMRIDEATEKPAFIAIASPPGRGGSELEFLIKPVPGSTTEELCALDAGGALQLSPVMGKGFDMSKLPSEDVKTVLLFATGSGISPIKALIETPEDAGGLEAASRSDVRLYYGALSPETMAFRELFEAWEASGVRVIPVFSQGCEDEKCYVQHVCREEGVSDGPSTGAVLVGQKEMVQDVKALLAECGMPEEHVVMNF